MRLLFKIVSAVLLGIVALLFIDGYLSVRREIHLFDADMAHDALVLGRALSPVVAQAWEDGGEPRALDVVKDASRGESHIQARWVWLDAPEGDDFAPHGNREELAPLENLPDVSFKQARGPYGGYRYTYVVVPVSGGRTGALELAESLSDLHSYTRATVVRKALLAALMTLSSVLILWPVGARYVGEPLSRLVEKTHRVGAGDFTGDVVVEGHDELANLALAMNQMCGQLTEARETVQRETDARITALDQLRHAERLAMLGKLSSGIAHELGTPLNVVAGRAKLIATEDLPHDDVVRFSRTIAEQAHRMTAIIRQLLDFARRPSTRHEPVDMGEVAAQVIDLLDSTARKTSVSLLLEKSDDVPVITVDRSKMQQVLMNLMMNGIQAMPGGGVLRIRMDVDPTPHRDGDPVPRAPHVAIHVEDEGEGIGEKDIGLVFDPFFTTKDVGEGTGLGLSISHGIVEEHGGWIDVKSSPGEGSCFSVYLPIEEER